ncbi:hypothetical protein ACFX2G_023080 [Malus domestica]
MIPCCNLDMKAWTRYVAISVTLSGPFRGDDQCFQHFLGKNGRVGLGTGLAIVVGGAAPGARHGVPLQCTVVDVLGGG